MVLHLLRIQRAIQATTMAEAVIRIHTVTVGEITILFQQPITMAQVTPIMVVDTAIVQEEVVILIAAVIMEEVAIRIAVVMTRGEEASARAGATRAVVTLAAALAV
ncbi:hypothetical protein LPJ54_006775, partial [Coemansia sp. RSA 1824]